MIGTEPGSGAERSTDGGLPAPVAGDEAAGAAATAVELGLESGEDVGATGDAAAGTPGSPADPPVAPSGAAVDWPLASAFSRSRMWASTISRFGTRVASVRNRL